MDDSPDHQPAVLDYATTTAAAPPGWPIGIYLAALAWAYITLSLVTQSWVAPLGKKGSSDSTSASSSSC